MMALSIRQPWAHWIIQGHPVLGHKDIENRGWATKHRGTFLVHAGKGIDPNARGDVTPEMPRGGIVGRVDMIDCIADCDSPWFFGPFGFVLANPRPLPFIPCRGRLSFFRPDIRDTVVRMHVAGDLSEGQASRILSIGRVALRTLADGIVTGAPARVGVEHSGGPS